MYDVSIYKTLYRIFKHSSYPGAAVHESVSDSEHVGVLSEFQQVPLKFFFILSNLTELDFQSLELLLKRH